MLVRGKTPSLMVDHGSVRHSPNLEGLAVHVLLSLSLSPRRRCTVCTVLCCENKHVGWHSLGNLDPESARSRESNLGVGVHRAGVCWLHPLSSRRSVCWCAIPYTCVAVSPRQYVIMILMPFWIDTRATALRLPRVAKCAFHRLVSILMRIGTRTTAFSHICRCDCHHIVGLSLPNASGQL